MMSRIAIGHRMDRSTVAMPGGEVRGANAFSRPVRMESGAATSAPYTEQQHGDLEVLGILRRRSAGPVQALDQIECTDHAELRIKLGPRDHELPDTVRGRPVQCVTAAVDELAVSLAQR